MITKLRTLAFFQDFEVNQYDNGSVCLVENHEHVSVMKPADSPYAAARKAPLDVAVELLKQLGASRERS